MTVTITPVPWQPTGGYLINYVRNPSAEGAGTLSVENSSGAAVSRVQFGATEGDFVYRVETTTAAAAAVRQPAAERPATSAGKTWGTRMRVRGATTLPATRQVRARIVCYDDAGNPVQVFTGPNVALSNAGLTAVELIVTTPAGTASIATGIERVSGATADVFYLDELLLTALPDGTSTVPDYWDGDFPTARRYRYSWAGAADASISQRTDLGPTATISPDLVLGYETSRPSATIVHRLLSGAVRFTLPPAGYVAPRTGTLTLFFESRADAWAALRLLDDASTFLYDDTVAGETAMVFAVVGTMTLGLDPETLSRWLLQVPYQEGPET